MRIALDATYSVDPYPSGIAVYSRELLSGLARSHPEDHFLFCYRPKQWRHAPRPSFANVRRCLLQPPFTTFRADLFHALNQRVDRRPAKRVVTTFHDLFVMTGEYSSPEFRMRFTKQARRAAQNSDLIIAVSRFTADQVRDLLGISDSRIRVVPHGVHRPAASALPRENSILFVGALQFRKNVARLVDAFEALPDGWRLVLAGSPSGYRSAEILDRIERSRCRERIQVTGYLSPSELGRLYARASIFAFPSLDEGFGIPVLEAMAHGVPVVASNRPPLAEVTGGTALLVDPTDTAALQTALARLVHNPDLRIELSALGRTRAALYPWERAVQATDSIYRELSD